MRDTMAIAGGQAVDRPFRFVELTPGKGGTAERLFRPGGASAGTTLGKAAPCAGEAELIAKCRRGESEAFEVLVRTHQHSIYNYVARSVGDGQAEDLAQEVFLRAYRSIRAFRNGSSFSTWLHAIATNVCRDYFRRKKREGQDPLPLEAPGSDGLPAPLEQALERGVTSPDSLNPEAYLEQRELEALVESCLSSLSPKHREVLVLHDMQGFKYEEIASVVGCSVGTVKSRLFYARAEMREKYEKMTGGGHSEAM
ncbi:MAG: sigma-70 family RNA polymerase sigma factor [Firmicutes bacterium]|nr:sigma-70 family RNA polymerase sigma factor [Bacillota bacterium]